MISENDILDCIIRIRGKKVMIDRDLASIYGVTTKRLNEQVKRNLSRFPEDFIFQPRFCSWNRDERKKGNKDECLSRFFGREHIEIW